MSRFAGIMLLTQIPSGKPLEESIMSHKPTRTQFSVLSQLCEWIPPYLVAKLARKHGVDAKARAFSPWSHVVALLYADNVTYLSHIWDGV